MRGKPTGIEHLWRLKTAGAAVAEELRQSYLDAIAEIIRRVSLAEEGKGNLTGAAGGLSWEEEPVIIFDLALGDGRTLG